MRDLTIGKTMGAHRQDKHHTKHSTTPLLVCWLVAVGILILVSSSGKSLNEPTQHTLPTTSSPQDNNLSHTY